MHLLPLPVLQATKRIGVCHLLSKVLTPPGKTPCLSDILNLPVCRRVCQSVHLKLVANKRLMPLQPAFHPGWCARGRMMSLSVSVKRKTHLMHQKKQAIFIADLGFGDAGKGTITDFLTRQLPAHTIVRYNGGPQAAHNVVTPDGKHHTFAQFGSGMLLPWTKTLLSRFMLINPLNMLKEERHLAALGVSAALERTWIDRRALIITPFQKAINRLREISRAVNRHGSCGEGNGECTSDALNYGEAVLFAGDLQNRTTVIKKLQSLREIKYAELAHLPLPASQQVRQELAIFQDGTCIEDCADVYRYFAERVKLVDEAALHTLFAQP